MSVYKKKKNIEGLYVPLTESQSIRISNGLLSCIHSRNNFVIVWKSFKIHCIDAFYNASILMIPRHSSASMNRCIRLSVTLK
jgi:chorismate mutase